MTKTCGLASKFPKFRVLSRQKRLDFEPWVPSESGAKLQSSGRGRWGRSVGRTGEVIRLPKTRSLCFSGLSCSSILHTLRISTDKTSFPYLISQMNPAVSSKEAKEWGLQRSLHVRLSTIYGASSDERLKSKLIHLTENYRSHEKILKFPSDLFYGGELIARVDQPLHPELGALVFHSVKGK